MALTQRSFANIDQLSLSTILDLQLVDGLDVAVSIMGKQREGVVSDAELAMQLEREDFRACQANLTDRKMAQSIALAVVRDGDFITSTYWIEDQLARDSQLAMSVHQEP
ncbi:hypothetical protein LTR95_011257 [Oleoguttula sp. CCFEE 5521]